jgi:precorrin-6Y C5,15-methyltransferase (decarboxylating)
MSLTIAGNGMGDYTFKNLPLDVEEFDRVICDINFSESGENILKLKYREAKEYILKNYSRENILYVVTGSPLFFSAGVLIAKSIPRDMVKIIDNTSSIDYLLSKLIIPKNQISVLSLHGRSKIDLKNFLTDRYTFILCDRYSIDKIREATKYLDNSAFSVIVGYKLGYSDEVIKEIDIREEIDLDLNQPYVLLVEKKFNSSPLSRDSEFKTERGMITKEYKRNLSLQQLDLEPNQILWDIGAGSGSCAIEAFKRYRVKTILFEKSPKRCEFIKENLKNHYVCDTKLIEGRAEEYFEKIEENPDRVFIGGGGSEVIKKIPYLFNRLNRNGVMVISAITLKNLSQMIAVLDSAEIPYEVISLSLTTYKGNLKLVEPERQLFQIKVRR